MSSLPHLSHHLLLLVAKKICHLSEIKAEALYTLQYHTIGQGKPIFLCILKLSIRESSGNRTPKNPRKGNGRTKKWYGYVSFVYCGIRSEISFTAVSHVNHCYRN